MSLKTGMEWPYDPPALSNLRDLTLGDRDWGCGTELRWIDFRRTQLESLTLNLFTVPPSMMFPETPYERLRSFGTGIPVNVLRV